VNPARGRGTAVIARKREVGSYRERHPRRPVIGLVRTCAISLSRGRRADREPIAQGLTRRPTKGPGGESCEDMGAETKLPLNGHMRGKLCGTNKKADRSWFGRGVRVSPVHGERNSVPVGGHADRDIETGQPLRPVAHADLRVTYPTTGRYSSRPSLNDRGSCCPLRGRKGGDR